MVKSPNHNTTTTKKRKSTINVFLWSHITALLIIPFFFSVAGSIIVIKHDIKSLDELKKFNDYKKFGLASLSVQALINIYIAILLSIIQGRTIYFLKKQFGSTF